MATSTSFQVEATFTSLAAPNPTIDQYSTALNGVNQSMNSLFKDTLWWSIGMLAVLILLIRVLARLQSHVRHLAGLSAATRAQQSYWAARSSWWRFKKDIQYAPLWKKRHNREIRLSSAINMGTLPSRFHAILLLAYLLSNFVYMAFLNYSRVDKYSVAAELRGRSGYLALANMIPLVILAGRNNPLIPLLQISFDTYNLFHRCFGRMFVLAVLVHSGAYLYVKAAAAGWSGVSHAILHDSFIAWGTTGTAASLLILMTSFSPVRHAFYETFKRTHILQVAILMLATLYHIDLAHLPQRNWIRAVIYLWIGDRVVRMLRTMWCNFSWGSGSATMASVESLPGDACRVTMHLPKHLVVKPGTHAYLRFATLNFWENHPFSIAWVDHIPDPSSLPLTEKRSQAPLQTVEGRTDVSFIIHAQTGLTKRLVDKAKMCSPRTLTLRAAFEGPYAGHHSLDSYGHVVLFAGSSGITHQLPYVRHLVGASHAGIVATRRVTLVWIVRDPDHLEWVRPWMDTILQMPGRRDVLRIKLFITRPKNPREIHSPSQSVQMFPGRPNVMTLLESEVREQFGAMCVTVCGPGGLADNVRQAVRGVQEAGCVDFIEESFTW